MTKSCNALEELEANQLITYIVDMEKPRLSTIWEMSKSALNLAERYV